MTENEQIEEMARIIGHCESILHPDIKCHSREHGCYCAENPCYNERIAIRLYSKDYRKVERGEWEEIDDGIAETVYRCTACNEKFYFESGVTIYAKFCPNCGADMRGNPNDG